MTALIVTYYLEGLKMYKQIWTDFVTAEDVVSIVDSYNAEASNIRAIDGDTALRVVELASDYYNYLDSADRAAAIKYDLHSFAEFATTGFTSDGDLEFIDRYEALLASGHPYVATDATATANWLAGAPELDEVSRTAVIASVAPGASDMQKLHAYTRLTVLASNNQLSPETMTLLEQVLAKQS
jgi:hypothetical protein